MSQEVIEAVRDYVYDCTRDEFGNGWTLSEEQTRHVLSLAKRTDEATELRQRLRMIISHASGGRLSEPGDIDRSINDICVEISRHKNEIWEQAQEAAKRTVEPSEDMIAAGCKALSENLRATSDTDAAMVRDIYLAMQSAAPKEERA